MRNKKRFSFFSTCLFVMSGMALILYPFVSNAINKHNQAQVIENYDDKMDELDDELLVEEKELSKSYNDGLLGNAILTDPFDMNIEKKSSEEYESRLNLDNDGVMGYLEIPVIDVKLPIYHGTGNEILDKGVGHLENTSLPVGGETTHAVLSAHTAYAKGTFFNNLIDVEEGDMFYLTVLNEKLAYQVDQIKVVDPLDTTDLLIEKGCDYVTLVTCTPYGVNSHRLLVRGTRVPYVEPEAFHREDVLQNAPSWLITVVPVIIVTVAFVIFVIARKRVNKGKKLKGNIISESL